MEESLHIREELCGPDSSKPPKVCTIWRCCGSRISISAPPAICRRAWRFVRAYLGPQDPDTIRTKFNLAWLAVTNGHSTTAEKQAAVPPMEEVLHFDPRENTSPNRYGFALIGLAMLRYDVESKPMHAAALVAEANRVLTENGDSESAPARR